MSVQTLYASGNWVNQTTVSILNGLLTGGSQIIGHPIAAPGVLSNLVVRRTTAMAGGASQTFTLTKNGSATAVTCTITAGNTTASDVTHSVSVVAGDILTLVCALTGTPGSSDYQTAVEFTPTTPGVSVYGFGSTASATSPFTAALFGVLWEATATVQQISVVSVPGTITALYVNHRTAPGVGNTRVFVLQKNGIDQDGAGGTVNTTSTISGAATTSSATFSLPVVAGDLLSIHQTSTGSPAASTACAGSWAFTATDGTAWMTGLTSTTADVGAVNYIWPVRGYNGTAPSATENLRENVSGVTSVVPSALYLQLPAVAGAGKSWTATLRTTTAGTPADTALAVTISGATDTTGALLHVPVTIPSGETWSIKLTPSGTPPTGSRPCRISLAMNVVPPPASTFNALLVSP